MILRAKTVVTMTGLPLEDGAVSVDSSGRITAVGPFAEVARGAPGGEVTDLGEYVLLPGLINAHCHLDYTGLRNALNRQASFTRWIARINALKRQMTNDDYLEAIAAGFREMRAWGTTSVCNLEAFPELLARMPRPPLRTWWFLELIDLRSRVPADTLLAGALSFLERHEDWLGGFGLNPHAPYTASPELYRLCAECAAECGLPLTTHLAESADEEAMFRRGEGELAAFMRQIGRPMDDCGHGLSSFANAVRNGLAGPGWLIAHANELDAADVALIAATPGDWHVVHCPRSHAFFGHRPFPWEALEAAGVCISLGTDSLASNESLSLFAEMQALQQARPRLTSETLLKTVTTHPARALGKAGELGVIRPGAHADLIALPFAGATAQVYDAIVANRSPVPWIMLNGNIL
ncbi:MAG: amidohydrolase family protein [Chthoniobacteraceae bacterium]|nr:amidohydrolase family protein [Chthoniobacteraceae bacterium]